METWSNSASMCSRPTRVSHFCAAIEGTKKESNDAGRVYRRLKSAAEQLGVVNMTE